MWITNAPNFQNQFQPLYQIIWKYNSTCLYFHKNLMSCKVQTYIGINISKYEFIKHDPKYFD